MGATDIQKARALWIREARATGARVREERSSEWKDWETPDDNTTDKKNLKK